jgi:hypothetical protein
MLQAMRPRRPESDEIGRMCVELRTQGMTLTAIAARVRARFGRSFSTQAVAYHLHPRDGRGRVRVGLSNPPSGWLHLVTVKRLLNVTMHQIDAHLWPRHEIRIQWNPPGPRYLFAEDVARVWPARWRRAVEHAAAEAERAIGTRRHQPSPAVQATDASRVPSAARATRVSPAPRELAGELVDIGSERPAIPVWRYSQYRSDVLYPKVVLAVAEVLEERGWVDAVEVLTRMRLLAPADVERWRHGQADCLEGQLRSTRSVGHATRVLGILRMHAIERGLVAERGVFLSEGDGPRALLQFSHDEDVNVEAAYATRYVEVMPRRASVRERPSRATLAP